MDYIILLPVFKNALLFKNYTYKFIKRYSLQDNCIMLIQNDDDEENYAEFIDIKKERVTQGKGRAINYMSHILPIDTNIVCMDDDVSGLIDVCGNLIDDVNELFIEMFESMHKDNITLSGFYPVANTFFMKKQKSITTHLTFIVGSCFLFINKRIPLETSGKDDYIFSIENFKYAGKVLRYNHIAIKYQYKAGIEQENDLQKFIDKYSDYINYVKYHKKGTSSIILKKIET
tara:strand:+ start:3826 stop:4518 length:693 start_codon:yes stop_codon:yes gene_type:complete